ncbi:MAG: dihydrolipoyl dehydrogenase family protein [bacterium]|jgi:glutathione reductase (NADPH)
MKTFDLAVIGTGTATSAVDVCSREGWKVAVIDDRAYGGTCALRGCNPKKVLVDAAGVVDLVRRTTGTLIEGEEPRIDWRQLMEFKRSFTEPVAPGREQKYRESGVAQYHGRAHFVSPHALQVGEEILEAKKILLANGASPMKLRIPGEEQVTTSDEFLELDALPEEIIFIGGGYISMEFAHVAARAGARVTILERGERILKPFEAELVNRLVEHSRSIGIEFQLNHDVKRIDQEGEVLWVRCSHGDETVSYQAPLVVHGGGRVPNTEGLDLEKGEVEYDDRGVKVNEYLQSISNPAVYAAGDISQHSAPPLSPVAMYEGDLVATNLLQGNIEKPDYRGIPSVCFTVPALASVGLREREIEEAGIRYRKSEGDLSAFSSVRRVGESCAAYQVYIDEENDLLLGAHLVGPEASEVINLFAMAIRLNIRSTELKSMMFAFPTSSFDIQYML